MKIVVTNQSCLLINSTKIVYWNHPLQEVWISLLCIKKTTLIKLTKHFFQAGWNRLDTASKIAVIQSPYFPLWENNHRVANLSTMNQVQEFGIPQTVSYLHNLSHFLCLAECSRWQKLPRKSCSTEGIIQAEIPQDSQAAQDPAQLLQEDWRHHSRFHIRALGKTSGTQKCLSVFCANFSWHMISRNPQRYSAVSQLQSKNRSINGF